MDKKELVFEAIELKKEIIVELANKIWEYAELSLQEYKSKDLFVKILKEEGFEVIEGNNNIETAFIGKYGEGRPYIGILAEYDALAGLSQKKGLITKEEIDSQQTGHGCGHNLLGAGALGAALGVKRYLEAANGKGTIFLYGCPGEEGGAAKAFMARDGEWKKLDAAITWHPEDRNEVATGSSNSCIQVQYKFKGIASHASGAPEKGRSALDAIELMNIGVQFLREHMTDDARIHYAITDAGGVSPNVVQADASVLYMVRANHVADAVKLQERVDKIAQGAALMTETSFERKFIDGLSDTISNYTLEKVLYENFEKLGVPVYTKEEHDFADKLALTYEGHDYIPGVAAQNDIFLKEKVKELRDKAGHYMNDFLCPLYQGPAFKAGSTDVGDVSWLTPTAQIHVAAWPNGCPGHSWQNVSCDGTGIGHKAAIHAAKVMAGAIVDLYEKPEVLSEAKREFEKRTESGFVCPIPKDAMPVIPD